MWCCSSTASPSASATAAGHRRYWLSPCWRSRCCTIRRARRTTPPFVNQGGCPKRLLHVRLLLRPAEQGQPAGGAEAAGGELPLRLVSVRCGLREILIAEMRPREWPLWALSRIAQRPRTALPDLPPSAVADARPPRGKSGFGPTIDIGRSLNRTAANKIYRLVCRQPKPNQAILNIGWGAAGPSRAAAPANEKVTMAKKAKKAKKAKRAKKVRAKKYGVSSGGDSARAVLPARLLGKEVP